jgi:hypothetical protein
MTRLAYLVLVRLHPREFRKRFGEEMVWIFEQDNAVRARLPLFSDAALSLARQWLMRSGAWKIAVAMLGGFVSIAAVLMIIGPD